MTFTKRLHPGILSGKITTTIRIWHKPRAKVGGRYRLGDGHVEVTRMREISLPDITPRMARDSGFEGVVDLLKVARHGRGEKIYLIDFVYRAA
ncbi:MAG: ASCH domain-containing protein [Alphaproteobacteria bacterium]|nr:ASCH domain-containing protein [Alphaproteobacteria bacterium]